MQPTLSFLERELVILAVLSQTQPAYALYAHARIAEKAGLSASQISDAKSGKLPDGLTKRERATYASARALAALRGPLPGGEFERAETVLGKDGTAAVMHLVGQFLYSSLLLNAADVPIPEES
jgi:AhpD family alkylhydroperoxidase